MSTAEVSVTQIGESIAIKTCKALQPSTRQRVVWVTALHRVCFDNSLFLPSFPISDMSDWEIENAAMGPRRWIELCGAYEKQHLNDPATILRPRATRIIDDLFATEEVDFESTDFFIVPGGRYVVTSSPDNISVLDMGYTSSADCKLIASVGPEGGSDTCIVQPTPDGMGLVIYSSYEDTCSVYEIYPQSETPRLTRIAHLDNPRLLINKAHLLPGTVIWHDCFIDRSDFRVWDYRLNHSISFSVVGYLDSEPELIATKTAVIILCEEVILIVAIPPLLPQPPDFANYNPTIVPPLFTITYPDEMALRPERIGWEMVSSWYSDTSHQFYFDMLCQDSKLHRFHIELEPDLSAASLHAINTSEVFLNDDNFKFFRGYRICEDTLVSFWRFDPHHCGLYTGLISARFSNVISHRGPAVKMLLPDIGREYVLTLCPASGRFVRLDTSNSVAILDFF